MLPSHSYLAILYRLPFPPPGGADGTEEDVRE